MGRLNAALQTLAQQGLFQPQAPTEQPDAPAASPTSELNTNGTEADSPAPLQESVPGSVAEAGPQIQVEQHDTVDPVAVVQVEAAEGGNYEVVVVDALVEMTQRLESHHPEDLDTNPIPLPSLFDVPPQMARDEELLASEDNGEPTLELTTAPAAAAGAGETPTAWVDRDASPTPLPDVDAVVVELQPMSGDGEIQGASFAQEEQAVPEDLAKEEGEALATVQSPRDLDETGAVEIDQTSIDSEVTIELDDGDLAEQTPLREVDMPVSAGDASEITIVLDGDIPNDDVAQSDNVHPDNGPDSPEAADSVVLEVELDGTVELEEEVTETDSKTTPSVDNPTSWVWEGAPLSDTRAADNTAAIQESTADTTRDMDAAADAQIDGGLEIEVPDEQLAQQTPTDSGEVGASSEAWLNQEPPPPSPEPHPGATAPDEPVRAYAPVLEPWATLDSQDTQEPIGAETEGLSQDEELLHEDGVTPHEDGVTPHEDGVTPHEVGVTPHEVGVTPHEVGVTPHEVGVTPHEDGVTPHEDEVTSHEDEVTPHEDDVTPYEDGASTEETAPTDWQAFAEAEPTAERAEPSGDSTITRGAGQPTTPEPDAEDAHAPGLPNLAALGRVPATDYEIETAQRLLKTEFGVRVQSLSEQLQAQLGVATPQSVLFTSLQTDEVRSDVLAALSMFVCAQHARPTLLVDADLDAHATSSHLDAKGPGLADVLTGRADWTSAVTATSCEKLHFLPCTPGASAAQLMSGGLPIADTAARLMEAWHEHYDLILLDGGTFSAATVRAFCRSAKATFLCVPLGAAEGEELLAASQELIRVGANLRGCITTGPDATA